MELEGGYSETIPQRIAQVPLSHLSIEVGHFYMNDLADPDVIRNQFDEVALYVRAHTDVVKARYGSKARVSTCFLLDDYFGYDAEPGEIIETLIEIATECGVVIDYLAREAGCWESAADRAGEPVRLAEMVAGRIVEEPLEGDDGGRPATSESGWLCNGRRGSGWAATGQAMRARKHRFPEELSRRAHSIFLDVEMWSKVRKEVNGSEETHTTWSCPYLATIWQLLRLGMLRYQGQPAVVPQAWADRDGWPVTWWELPAVVQLNPDAKPFAAYRALSILPRYYLGIEHAVQVILDHLQQDAELVEQVAARGQAEKVKVPGIVSERLDHLFLGGI